MQNNDISTSGMLLIDKPLGFTSFKVTQKIKKILNVKKTGHCGTLDPMATGLLLIMINKATKLQDNFMKKDKVYTSTFLLGTHTDSGDMEGNIIEQKDFGDISLAMIEKALEQFKGEIEQIPPMYSAIKVNGEKLYNLARKGIEIERKPRKVTIKRLEIISFKDGLLDLIIECTSGTYIRSLASDLGKALGCGATVSKLRREKINGFDVADALKEADFQDTEKIKEKIIPLDSLFTFPLEGKGL